VDFILLAHWHGRFGNRMHQYAYGATFSKINNVKFILPSDWEGTKLFKNQIHEVCDNNELKLHINQSKKPFDSIEYRTFALKKYLDPNIKKINPAYFKENFLKQDDNIFFDDMCAYDESIFKKMSKKYLKYVFELSDEVKNLDIYKKLEDKQGSYDIAHLRRDDVADARNNMMNHQGYSVVSKESYFKAFKKYGFDKDKMLWVSDDHKKQWHKEKDTSKKKLSWKYPIGSEYSSDIIFDWLEDWLTLYFARSIFRANSSFSWWAAFLSPTAKIYSPVLDKQIIYGVDGLKELDVNFIEGNHPHWMYNKFDIHIKDE
jgi:hypothetical protein